MKKILAAVFCLAVSLFAKEWEQSFVVTLFEDYYSSYWAFGDEGLFDQDWEKLNEGAYWVTYETCVCDFAIGDCLRSLYFHKPDKIDDQFWRVKSMDSLVAGKVLDLEDTAVFDPSSYRDADIFFDTYFMESKDSVKNDTNYFVYRKDSSYYALCQYITVYDTLKERGGHERGIPSYYAHQCVYQDDGTPTFSVVPAYTDSLPAARRVDYSRWNIGTDIPIKKESSGEVLYQINGTRSAGNKHSRVNAEKGRVVRSLR